MRFKQIIICTALLCSTLWANLPEKFDIDAAHSKIGFAVEFMGLTEVEGRFTKYSGALMFDENDLTRLSTTLIIDLEGIDTDNDFRDRHLKSPDWFDAEKFPTIFFQSKRVEKIAEGYVMIGDLTIRNITKETHIPFKLLHGKMSDMWENTRVGFLGELTLNRRDFGVVGNNVWNRTLDLDRFTIGDSVKITLNIQGRIPNTEKMGFGRPEKKENIAAAMIKTYETQGIKAALAQFREAKEKTPEAYTFNKWGLNILGYRLLQRQKASDAVEILQLLVENYPEDANAYDSLGDAYAALNQRDLAIENYRRSLELDPKNAGAIEMLRYLEGNGRAAGK